MSTPRGLRNNNPGNIRKSSTLWQGEVASTDPDFKKFRTMAYGYRAMFKLLMNYTNTGDYDGIHDSTPQDDTIREIISRWAPSSENNTLAYINSVSRSTGIPADQKINSKDFITMRKIVAAISQHENGVTPVWTDIDAGWNLLNAGKAPEKAVKAVGIGMLALVFFSALGYVAYHFIHNYKA